MVHSIEFKFSMYITGYRRTNPIDFGEYEINSFFSKKNSYKLRPMESNSLKYRSSQTVHSIEFKFGMYTKLVGHRRTNPINFSEYRMNSFL